MPESQEFDPSRDGWNIRNWHDAVLTPEAFSEAFLGVNPNSVLDDAFYKSVREKILKAGNCCGMSALALAIFKYGGYMGFCSPANFYGGDLIGHMEGGKRVYAGPDDDTLRKAINALHTRQLSANAIENYIDLINANNWNDIEAAFVKVKELLGRGDYPILSIGNLLFANGKILEHKDAHQVIPYKIIDYGNGHKAMYIWDSNFPYKNNPERYDPLSDRSYVFRWGKIPGTDTTRLREFLSKKYHIDWVNNAAIVKSNDGKSINISIGNKTLSLTLNNDETKVIIEISDGRTDKFRAKEENNELNIYEFNCLLDITGPFEWTYYGANDYNSSKSNDCSCLVIPLSSFIKKSRYPGADMIASELMTILIAGSDAKVNQITDDKGHKFYKTDTDMPQLQQELELDPARRIKDIVRWPWFGANGESNQCELYFMRSAVGRIPFLELSVSGKESKISHFHSGCLIEITSMSSNRSKDIVTISRALNTVSSIEIKTLGGKREIGIKQIRTVPKDADWRSFDIKNVSITQNTPLKIDTEGYLDAVHISSGDKEVEFEANIAQSFRGKVLSRSISRISTASERTLRIAPSEWNELGKTAINIEKFKL